jgi:uncharacterized protein HemX
MTTVIAVLAVLIALAIGVLVYVVKAQTAKLKVADLRAEKAERDSAGYQQAFASAEARAARLKQALEKNAAVEEETNGEQQELAATPNTELVTRANRLFGGMSDKPQN